MPRVFISYSWEDDEHKEWVKQFASDLRTKSGIESILDRWHLVPGDQLPEFMEREIRENDFVLMICTPTYKNKADNRRGGVGYEGDIITAEIFNKSNHRKYIPILRKGEWLEASPTSVLGKYYFDLRGDITSETHRNIFDELSAVLLDIKEEIPAVAEKPIERLSVKKGLINNKIKEGSFVPIKINKVLINEVTAPKLDGTKGSALYKIPFELSEYPSNEWREMFINAWKSPFEYTSMHRPSIAKVIGKKIILDGTTMDEVKLYHKKTLKLAIERANKYVIDLLEEKSRRGRLEYEKKNEHEEYIKSLADELIFD